MARFHGMVTINQDLCKGCALCVTACPLKILVHGEGINRKGYHPAAPPDPARCSACGSCALMCPDICITVRRAPAPEEKP
jgi:2-oxoglutarate ferredoxin oxidoreductase subunit delta